MSTSFVFLAPPCSCGLPRTVCVCLELACACCCLELACGCCCLKLACGCCCLKLACGCCCLKLACGCCLLVLVVCFSVTGLAAVLLEPIHREALVYHSFADTEALVEVFHKHGLEVGHLGR